MNQAPLESLKKQIEAAPPEQLPILLSSIIRACIKAGTYDGKPLGGVVQTIEKQVRGQ